MKRGPLMKYRAGLFLVGIFTLVLLGLVVASASSTKSDAATEKQANAAADKLNSYGSTNETAPASLAAAGYHQSAANLGYTKLSASSYKFCVTYKADSTDFDAGAVATSLATGGKLDDGQYNDTDTSYLVIPTSHHKGKNCQTITVTSYDSSGALHQSTLCDETDPCEADGSTTGDTTSRGSGSAGITNQANDSKRKTDIGSLQATVESYYATNNAYPTLAEINSSSWRSANLDYFDATALCDPSAGSQTNCSLSAAAGKGLYGYAPTTSTKATCTISGSCQGYTLTATLSDGTAYQKTAL